MHLVIRLFFYNTVPVYSFGRPVPDEKIHIVDKHKCRKTYRGEVSLLTIMHKFMPQDRVIITVSPDEDKEEKIETPDLPAKKY